MALTLRCPKHPTYTGTSRQPHTCADCWELYRLVHEDQGSLIQHKVFK